MWGGCLVPRTTRRMQGPLFVMNIDGFILIGGASSRMGTDKSKLVFDGLTAVERIAAALSVVTNRVRTVGRMGAEFSSALPHVTDVHANLGALGGIHAALRATGTEWAAIVACDLPFVTDELFVRLSSFIAGDAKVAAIVPIQDDGRQQPLCALYKRDPCLLKAETLIACGEHTPRALFEAGSTRWIQPEELADLRHAKHFFVNLNRPEDYQAAKEILSVCKISPLSHNYDSL